jgi:cytochrome b subunit of formate dehydrogenase
MNGPAEPATARPAERVEGPVTPLRADAPSHSPRPIAVSERGEGPMLWRFSRLDRVLHGLMVFSFFGLVLTEIPLHFSYAPWARQMVRVFGGFQAAGLIHRFCAIITFFYFFTHIGTVAYRFWKSEDRKGFFTGPNTMVPRLKDLQDVVAQFKWYLGQGPRPQFDRFSYMEKFDYWAVFWGVAIIGGSGVMLWFPEFFAGLLPGWVFNVATIVHGDEALLALGFIFTIHFFNVHLRPEKFPIDLVIFTGRATAEYMREEHPLEYQRLLEEGRLGELEAPPADRSYYVWSLVLGFGALGLGILTVATVIWTILLH